MGAMAVSFFAPPVIVGAGLASGGLSCTVCFQSPVSFSSSTCEKQLFQASLGNAFLGPSGRNLKWAKTNAQNEPHHSQLV